MKKLQQSHFYNLTTGPDAAGRPVRYYELECRCGRKITQHAGSFTDEKLRKLFMRAGWDVGKTQAQHRCPDCQHRRSNVVPMLAQLPEQPQVNRLEAAWLAASEAERADFMQKIFGQVWDASPVVQADSTEAAPAEPAAEPEPAADDAPADWWTDLQDKSA